MTAEMPNTRHRPRPASARGLALCVALLVASLATANELEGTWRLQGGDDPATVDAEKRLPIFIRHRDRSAQDAARLEAWDGQATAERTRPNTEFGTIFGKGTSATTSAPANKTSTTFELKKGFIQIDGPDGLSLLSYSRVGERIMMPSMGGGTRDKHFFYYADAWPGTAAHNHGAGGAGKVKFDRLNNTDEPQAKRDHDTKMAIIRNMRAAETPNPNYRFDCHLPERPQARGKGIAHVRVIDGTKLTDTRMRYRVEGHLILLLDEDGRVKVKFPWSRPGVPSGDPDVLGQPPLPRSYVQANQSDLDFLGERARPATTTVPATPTVRPRPQRPTPRPRMRR